MLRFLLNELDRTDAERPRLWLANNPHYWNEDS
jgi:hypothetical protein